jgi:hypothetical protein
VDAMTPIATRMTVLYAPTLDGATAAARWVGALGGITGRERVGASVWGVACTHQRMDVGGG